MHCDEDGAILNLGRKTRTISPALRRALEVRDRGCRFPGCGHRFTDAHHVKHWADGGSRSPDYAATKTLNLPPDNNLETQVGIIRKSA